MAEQNPRVPKRIAAVIINSLKGGVVPRIGLPYITVGREREIGAFLTDLGLIESGGASFRFLVGRYGAGKSFLLQTIRTHAMGEGASLVTDIPRYRVYENGVFTKELTDASAYWKEGYVGFLIGCSFSFEEALLAAGIPVRHIEQGCNVPMFKTSIATKKAGPFEGPMVCSMRPMTPEQARRAYEITAAMPNVHGAPVQIGHPEAIGVADVMKPDYGDPVEIREGEIPVFWPCGVTPQAAVENAKPPIVITHAPGHMFITDIRNADLNDYLERRKQNQ